MIHRPLNRIRSRFKRSSFKEDRPKPVKCFACKGEYCEGVGSSTTTRQRGKGGVYRTMYGKLPAGESQARREEEEEEEEEEEGVLIDV